MSALEPLTNQAERLEWLPDGMNWRSTWDVATQYVKNDVVRSPLSDATFVANANSLGGLDPAITPAPSIWTELGGGGSALDTSVATGPVLDFSGGGGSGPSNGIGSTGTADWGYFGPIIAAPHTSQGVWFSAFNGNNDETAPGSGIYYAATTTIKFAVSASIASHDSILCVITGPFIQTQSGDSGICAIGVADDQQGQVGYAPLPTSYDAFYNVNGQPTTALTSFPAATNLADPTLPNNNLGGRIFLASAYVPWYAYDVDGANATTRDTISATFILKKGKDYTENTRNLIFGVASYEKYGLNPCPLWGNNVPGTLGINCQLVGL